MSHRTFKMSLGFIAVVALVLTAGVAQASTWDGGGADDNWTTANNWNPDGVPAVHQDHTFSGGSPCDITTAVDANTLSLTAAGFTMNLTGTGDLDADWGFKLQADGTTFNWAGNLHAVGRSDNYSPYTQNYHNGAGVPGRTQAINISGSATGGIWYWEIGCMAGEVETVKMTGSSADVHGWDFKVDQNSVVKYVFDASGISPIWMKTSIQLDWDSSAPGGALGGDLVIDLAAYTLTVPSKTFTLLDGPTGTLGATEDFNSVTIQNAHGLTAVVNYGSGAGGNGDVTVTLTPEPATMALLAVGGLGMLIRRRRSRKS